MLIENSLFWLFIAFIVFLAFIYIKYAKKIGEQVEGGISSIRAELERTQTLLKEAKKQLSDRREDLEQAEQQAIDIKENVQEEIEILKEEFSKKLIHLTRQLERQAAEKIAKAERDAFEMIKNTSIEIAMRSAQQILETKYQDRLKSKQYLDLHLKQLKVKN